MTRKDAKDYQQKNYENSVKLVDTQAASYRQYTTALSSYLGGPKGDSALFKSLAEAGDIYFYHISLMCDTILSGKVDEEIRDNTWLPKIRVAYERSLPKHYQVLQSEAAKYQIPYSGKLRRQDHESVYAVVEKFSGTHAWEKAARDDDQ